MDISDQIPPLPLAVLTRVASLLQPNERGYTFTDRIRLSAVSRDLRLAVLASCQQMTRRCLAVRLNQANINVNGVVVENAVRSTYFQMDCVGALTAFGQPNAVILSAYYDSVLKNQLRILTLFPPLSLTHLQVGLQIEAIGRLDEILQAVSHMSNLEVLMIRINITDNATAAHHKASSPSLPTDSPFNHLLTLGHLRTFRIEAERLLSSAQMAELLNRCQSSIDHVCCADDSYAELDKLFARMDISKRAGITSLCCVGPSSHSQSTAARFLPRLPNCSSVHYKWFGGMTTKEAFDQVAAQLLDCCLADEAHRGRTLEWHIGILEYYEVPLQYQNEPVVEYARDGTVVRLVIGTDLAMGKRHCAFSESLCDFL